jgi:hypothetical protein
VIRKVLIVSLVMGFALALGWALADIPAPTASFGEDSAFAMPQSEGAPGSSPQTSLAVLYERSAWSAGAPSPVEGEAEKLEEAEPLPEGLDRFALLGIISVSGQAPEAFLRDFGATDEQAPVFRATQGEDLRLSGVMLEAIGKQRIRLAQAGETQELFLFRRIEPETDTQIQNSTNGSSK